MAPRHALTIVLVALLGLPTLAAADGPQPPPLPPACAPMPDCAVGKVAEVAAPALAAAGEAQDRLQPTVDMAVYYGSLLIGPAVPDSSDSIVLAGVGIATVRLGGAEQVCEGEPRMVLEASRKSFGLEPSVTFGYGGGRGDGALLMPCARGQTRQPVANDISGSFEGAWSATKSLSDYTWSITVGAPAADGTRAVSYWYESEDGTRHTFDGVLAEYR